MRCPPACSSTRETRPDAVCSLTLSAVTGPPTDNAVGVKIIEEQMGVRAVNAMAAGAVLGDHIIESLGLSAQLARAASE